MPLNQLMIQLEEAAIPSPGEAREVVFNVLAGVKRAGFELEIAPFKEALMPEPGDAWELSRYITLLPGDAEKRDEKHAFRVTYIRETDSQNGSFLIKAPLGYKTVLDAETRDYIDDRAERLRGMAERWLEVRPARVAHLRTSNFFVEADETAGNAFPRVVTWWMWVGEEIAEHVGRAKLLEAPVHDAYELADGVAWQLTDAFSEKPHPSLLSDLKAMFPNEPPRVAIGHD